jgi:DNA-binding MarR family transcriptional regulator
VAGTGLPWRTASPPKGEILMQQNVREKIGSDSEGVSNEQSKALYLDSLRLIERLHRRLLDVIKVRLDSLGLGEINSVQALLLYNIGTNEMTAGELRSRGYYTGSNVSYNLKKLVEGGYIEHERSRHDRRSVRIRLSDKGKEICDIVDELYEGQVLAVTGDALLGDEGLRAMNETLKALERFWSDQIQFGGF